jgi:hypothetical protein
VGRRDRDQHAYHLAGKIKLSRVQEIIKEEVSKMRAPAVKLGASHLRSLISEMVGDDEEPEDISSRTAGEDEKSLFSMLSPDEKRKARKGSGDRPRRSPSSEAMPMSRSRQMDIEDRRTAARERALRLQKIKDRQALRKSGAELSSLYDPDPRAQSAAFRRRMRKQGVTELAESESQFSDIQSSLSNIMQALTAAKKRAKRLNDSELISLLGTLDDEVADIKLQMHHSGKNIHGSIGRSQIS